MTVSRLRVDRSETREFGDRERASSPRFAEPADWNMRDSTFFTAFVVIALVLVVVALVLR